MKEKAHAVAFNSLIRPRLLQLLHFCPPPSVCVCVSLRAVLGPLLDLPPPAQTLMLVVDSLDVGHGTCGAGGGRRGSLAELLAANQHLLPGWLLLVCSVRRSNKTVCKMFSGTEKERDCEFKAFMRQEIKNSVMKLSEGDAFVEY